MAASGDEPLSDPPDEAGQGTGAIGRPVLLTLGAVWILVLVFALADGVAGFPHAPLALLAVVSGALALALRLEAPHHLERRPVTGRDEPGDLPSAPPLPHGPRDGLTRLPTFQPFSEQVLHEFQLAKARGRSLALVLIDINDLAGINDQFGSGFGDEALRRVADCLGLAKRTNDLLARLGDDEFGLVLKDCSREGAVAFVERVYERLARESIRAGQPDRPVTIWVGVCAGVGVLDSSIRTADDLITEAIGDLNAAKASRDRRRERWLAAS